ncbi:MULTISPECIES: hypothetical protein, partial [unclassified Microcoleus]|uniref:hypothetical protein n=1 Tax=unclassified Microcoleus TaxID=2642155 RepID=UPI002FD33820
ILETGFLPLFLVLNRDYSQKPGFSPPIERNPSALSPNFPNFGRSHNLRNRVSSLISRTQPRLFAETRFLATWATEMRAQIRRPSGGGFI